MNTTTKRLLTGLVSLGAAITLSAKPSNALPLWAEFIAASHCEYMEMGVGRDQALNQALADNSHWNDEMLVAIKNEVFAKAVARAILEKCPTLLESPLSIARRVVGMTSRYSWPPLPELR